MKQAKGAGGGGSGSGSGSGSFDSKEDEEIDAALDAKDPAELRRRMDDIKSEMVAVAEQMAEMERRLLAQQASLERAQADLENGVGGGNVTGNAKKNGGGGTGMDDFVSEAADDDRIVKTLKPSGASMQTDIANIEETKKEIQDALSRIDKMQADQSDLIK
jgi:prefoldin subunit 5